MNRMTSRKFLTLVGLLVTFTWLLIADHITEQTFRDLVILCISILFGLQALNKIKGVEP